MKKRSTALIALLMACMMVAAFVTGCSQPAAEVEATPEAPTDAVTPTEAPVEPSPEVPVNDTPLVVAYSPFSEKFSQFYADTGYDQDVTEAVGLVMMTTDRMGGIIFNAIEGETVNYNGTDYLYTGPADISVNYDEATDITTYRTKIREDLVFSDGTPVTIDDLIFTYYVYLDPDYNGSTTLNSYDIVGLQNYLTQTSDDIYAKYQTIVEAVDAAGLGYTVAEGDAFTQEQYDYFYTKLEEFWKADVQGIVDYVFINYAGSYAEGTLGKTPDEVGADEGLKVALGMALWGFGEMSDDLATLTAAGGATFDIAGGVYPTIDDYFAAVKAKYATAADYIAAGESASGADVVGTAKADFITHFGTADPEGTGGIPNVSGIVKVDEYTVEVLVNGYSAPAVYSICGLIIAPKHYYGDGTYDFAANNFGHPFGDLSVVQEKNTQPLGAGPYKFVKYENKIVYYEANENYFKGKPIIQNMQWLETASNEVAPGVVSGTVDAGELTGSKANFDQIRGYNSNGELSGDVVHTSRVDNLGYGYLGANADTVAVNGEPGSDASKNLRKAMMTVFSVFRELSVNSYYGDAAAVINYPISNTSWAAPQPTDEGYHVAFSQDVDGNPIYTADMTQEQKEAAAIQAALGFFAAAGFTVEDGKVVAGPEGARGENKTYLEYEAIIPADGIGDHPAFAILSDAKAAFESIGITLTINDPADSNILWDALDAGTQDFWTAAWGSTIDPDMYQVYHSSNIVGLGGSDSNHYHLQSDVADALIMDARESDDQAYRKSVYKQVLDDIMDWAVELPTYQRQNCIVFSSQRINIDTLTPDITTYWGWMSEIEKLEMNQ